MFTSHGLNSYFSLAICTDSGKTGSVSVNQDGDRNEDYAIYDFQNNTLERVAYYDGFRKEYIPEREVSKLF